MASRESWKHGKMIFVGFSVSKVLKERYKHLKSIFAPKGTYGVDISKFFISFSHFSLHIFIRCSTHVDMLHIDYAQ